jgi:hypothetical protein
VSPWPERTQRDVRSSWGQNLSSRLSAASPQASSRTPFVLGVSGDPLSLVESHQTTALDSPD